MTDTMGPTWMEEHNYAQVYEVAGLFVHEPCSQVFGFFFTEVDRTNFENHAAGCQFT